MSYTDPPDERDFLVPPLTPPPAYYRSFSSKKSMTPPPKYQDVSTNRTRIQADTIFDYRDYQPSDYSSLAAVAFFCCCCSPFACIALYYSARVREYYQSAEIESAYKASSRTRCCSIIAIIMGFILLISLILFTILFCMFTKYCSNTLNG